jgi:hypothetical protein
MHLSELHTLTRLVADLTGDAGARIAIKPVDRGMSVEVMWFSGAIIPENLRQENRYFSPIDVASAEIDVGALLAIMVRKPPIS